MNNIKNWIDIKIKDIFASSIPGDWGVEGSQDDGIPVLRSTNFRNSGIIDYSDIAYRKVEQSRLDKRLIKKGTILIEKSGGSPNQPAGRVVYSDFDLNGTASNFIEIIKVMEDFEPRYVAYLLYYLYKVGLVLKYQQQTTGIINFKLNEYVEEIVSCPVSKNEQAKIAEILETVDCSIKQLEALIEKQERIKVGLMQDILTKGIDEHGNIRSEETHEFKDSPLGRIPVEWDTDLLGSRALVKGGKRLPAGHAYSEGDTGYRYLQTTDFISKKLIYSKLHNLSYSTFKILQRYEIFDGDIFISIAGINLGVAGVFRSDFNERTILTENAAKINLLKDDLPEYIATQINGHLVQKQILEDKGIGAGVPKLALFRIQNLLLLWAEKEEQIRIVNCIHGINVYLDLQKDNLKKLELLKTAIMQDLLTGKKRVTPLLKEIEVIN